MDRRLGAGDVGQRLAGGLVRDERGGVGRVVGLRRWTTQPGTSLSVTSAWLNWATLSGALPLSTDVPTGGCRTAVSCRTCRRGAGGAGGGEEQRGQRRDGGGRALRIGVTFPVRRCGGTRGCGAVPILPAAVRWRPWRAGRCDPGCAAPRAHRPEPPAGDPVSPGSGTLHSGTRGPGSCTCCACLADVTSQDGDMAHTGRSLQGVPLPHRDGAFGTLIDVRGYARSGGRTEGSAQNMTTHLPRREPLTPD